MKFRRFSVWVAFLLLAGVPSVFGQSITNFTPKLGTNGDLITITGTGFGATTKIYFWKNTAPTVQASIFVNTPNEITAQVPAGITTGPIGVQNGSGSTNQSIPSFTVVGPGPFVTDFSPQFGSRGDPNIIINGVHLATATFVRFSGTNAGFTGTTDGLQIFANVPVNAKIGTNFISVTSPTGSFTNQTPFIVFGPGPIVTNVTPFSGGPGNTIVIEGLHFLPGSGHATNVTFNGKLGTGFVLNTDNRLQVNVPSGITTGPLVVLSALGTLFNFVTPSNFYGRPIITSLSPTNGRAGTNLVIMGTNFTSASLVEFGGTNGPFSIGVVPSSVTSNTIQVSVPNFVVSNPIRVTTLGGTIATSSNFVVLPTISGFSPQFGRPGTNVIVTGANFTAAGLTVKFGGLNAASVSNVSFGQLTATVPNNATNAPITVTTVDGSATSSQTFFLLPIITGFTPTNAPVNSIVTISGQNLLGTTNVSFNGTLVIPNQPVSNSTVRVTVPDGVVTGPISVFTPGGVATSAAVFYGAPVITSFNPTHGLPGTNVAIFGTNFIGATNVRFNGTNAAFSIVDNFRINAVATNSFDGPITVIGPAGIATSAIPFTLDFTNELAVTLAGGPSLIFIGGDLTYTLTVTNGSSFSAPNVIVSNTLPPVPGSVILKSASTTLGALNTNGNPVTLTINSLGVSGSATVTLVVVPQVSGTITNRATVIGPYFDPVLANNTAVLTTTVLPTPVLSIQLYTPTQIQVSWPLALTDFVLQYNNALAGSSGWSNVNIPPFPVGDQKVVIDTLGSNPKFYRLKR